MHNAFLEVQQRPFPLPTFPWVMTQKWNHLLMLHWPVSRSILEPFVPKPLQLDTYENTAWISFIPFKVTKMRLRGLPKFPYLHTFTEMNIRTYVTYRGNGGVYFFSLNANKWLHVLVPKLTMLLPYYYAKIKLHEDDAYQFSLERRKEKFTCAYSPTSAYFLPSEGSLDYWLLERYCFWIVKGKWLFRGDIHHDRWRITEAKGHVSENSLASFLPRSIFQEKPRLHFTEQKQVFVWPLTKEKNKLN